MVSRVFLIILKILNDPPPDFFKPLLRKIHSLITLSFYLIESCFTYFNFYFISNSSVDVISTWNLASKRMALVRVIHERKQIDTNTCFAYVRLTRLKSQLTIQDLAGRKNCTDRNSMTSPFSYSIVFSVHTRKKRFQKASFSNRSTLESVFEWLRFR